MLLHLLATDLRAHAGSFCIGPHRISTWRGHRPPLAAVRRLIGFFPDEPGHFLDLTVQESAWLYARACGLPRGPARARVAELLDWAGLGAQAAQPLRGCDYAARRRLALVQALVHQPGCCCSMIPAAASRPASGRNWRAPCPDLAAGGADGPNTLVQTRKARRRGRRTGRYGRNWPPPGSAATGTDSHFRWLTIYVMIGLHSCFRH